MPCNSLSGQRYDKALKRGAGALEMHGNEQEDGGGKVKCKLQVKKNYPLTSQRIVSKTVVGNVENFIKQAFLQMLQNPGC